MTVDHVSPVLTTTFVYLEKVRFLRDTSCPSVYTQSLGPSSLLTSSGVVPLRIMSSEDFQIWSESREYTLLSFVN